jgi:hypothetical protein
VESLAALGAGKGRRRDPRSIGCATAASHNERRHASQARSAAVVLPASRGPPKRAAARIRAPPRPEPQDESSAPTTPATAQIRPSERNLYGAITRLQSASIPPFSPIPRRGRAPLPWRAPRWSGSTASIKPTGLMRFYGFGHDEYHAGRGDISVSRSSPSCVGAGPPRPLPRQTSIAPPKEKLLSRGARAHRADRRPLLQARRVAGWQRPDLDGCALPLAKSASPPSSVADHRPTRRSTERPPAARRLRARLGERGRDEQQRLPRARASAPLVRRRPARHGRGAQRLQALARRMVADGSASSLNDVRRRTGSRRRRRLRIGDATASATRLSPLSGKRCRASCGPRATSGHDRSAGSKQTDDS